MSSQKKRPRRYPVKGHYRCTRCGRRGHNAKTCPEAKGEGGDGAGAGKAAS
jgi:hypothetical protein